jgi:hypothetical protein
MEEVPYDVLKETLLYLQLPDLLNICQTEIHVYNVCKSDNFWLQYLIFNYQNVPVHVFKGAKNNYSGYKQIATQMYNGSVIFLDNGLIIPVKNDSNKILIYTTVSFDQTFEDLFVQIESEIPGISMITLMEKPRSWKIFIDKYYKDDRGFVRSKPDFQFNIIYFSASLFVPGDNYRTPLKADVPMNNISPEEPDYPDPNIDITKINSIIIRFNNYP